MFAGIDKPKTLAQRVNEERIDSAKRIKELEEALEFYAKPGNYSDFGAYGSAIIMDRGFKARSVLERG